MLKNKIKKLGKQKVLTFMMNDILYHNEDYECQKYHYDCEFSEVDDIIYLDCLECSYSIDVMREEFNTMLENYMDEYHKDRCPCKC